MTGIDPVANKIKEVKEEMKRTGVWKQEAPAWVNEFDKRAIASVEDFSEWLQFVYLPNMQQVESKSGNNPDNYIVPQAMRFFGEDMKKGKLLQLLIELDSLA